MNASTSQEKPEPIRVYEDFLDIGKHVDDPVSSIIEMSKKLNKLVTNKRNLSLLSLKSKQNFIERVMENIDATKVSFSYVYFFTFYSIYFHC